MFVSKTRGAATGLNEMFHGENERETVRPEQREGSRRQSKAAGKGFGSRAG